VHQHKKTLASAQLIQAQENVRVPPALRIQNPATNIYPLIITMTYERTERLLVLTPLPQNAASTNSISTQSKRPNSNRLKPSNQATTKYQLNPGNQITTNKISRRTLQE
jgi:hypothetical protein